MAPNISPSQRAFAPLNDYIKLRVLASLVHKRVSYIGATSARTPYNRAAAGAVLAQLTAAGLVRFVPDTPAPGVPDYCGQYHAIVPNSVLAGLAHKIAVRVETAEGGAA